MRDLDAIGKSGLPGKTKRIMTLFKSFQGACIHILFRSGGSIGMFSSAKSSTLPTMRPSRRWGYPCRYEDWHR